MSATTLLCTSSSAAAQAIDYLGKPLFSYYPQAQLLSERPEFAAYRFAFAQAYTLSADRDIEWHAPAAGHYIPVLELPDSGREAASADIAAIWDILRSLHQEELTRYGNNFSAQLLYSLIHINRPELHCFRGQDGSLVLAEWGLKPRPAEPAPAPIAEPIPAAASHWWLWLFNALVGLSLLCALIFAIFYFLRQRDAAVLAAQAEAAKRQTLSTLAQNAETLRDRYRQLNEHYRSLLDNCPPPAAPEPIPDPEPPQPEPETALKPPPAPKPLPALAKGASFVVPNDAYKKKDLSFIKGTYYSDELIHSQYPDDYPRHPREDITKFRHAITFNNQGKGSDKPIAANHNQCRSSVRAKFKDAKTIIISYGSMKCSLSPPLPADTITCKIKENNQAYCYIYNQFEKKYVYFPLKKGK